MPSSEPTIPKLSVDDVLALSEADLVQFMKRNHGPDNDFDLPIEGWEKLAKDKRDRLAERLRIGAQKASAELQSRAVDLDQVTNQLFKIFNKDTSTQVPSRPSYEKSPTRSPPTRVAEEHEIECHNNLVDEGGRPAYPISLLDQVFQDPGEYREMLQPWQELPDESTPDPKVFQRQLDVWHDFRIWQQENRGIYDDDSEYLAFVEKTRRHYVQTRHTEGLGKLEANSSCLKPTWYARQDDRLQDLRYLRENHGRGGFSEYIEEVKRRLAQHGFTRIFRLEEDPKQQDKLTTWMEYLNYEYSWYDRYSRDVKRLQPLYDKAWQKLVGSGVLRPSETDEYLHSYEAVFRFEGETDAAEKRVESARLAAGTVLISTQTEPQRSSLTKPVRLQMIRQSRSRLTRAEESLKALKRRGDLIGNFVAGTRDYKTAQRNAKRQSIRLQWILEQVPQIEAELNESKAVESNSNAERGTKRRLGRDQDDEVTTDRKPTKRRRNDRSLRSDGKAGSKRSHRNDTIDEERLSKRPRIDNRDSDFQRQAALTRGLQTSEVPAARRQSGDGKVALETSGAPGNGPLQSADCLRPSIELESQSKTNSDSRRGRKRGPERSEDEIGGYRNSKRQKRNAPDQCSHDDTNKDEPLSKRYKNGRELHRSRVQTPDKAETATVGRRKKSARNTPQSPTTSQPLRRSARIAARQKPVQTVMSQPSAAKIPPRRARASARANSKHADLDQTRLSISQPSRKSRQAARLARNPLNG